MQMLNHVDLEGMREHVKILGLLMIVSELIPVLCAPLTLGFLVMIGAISDDPDAAAVLATIGSFAFCVTVVFALPGLVAGIGLLRRQEWARYLALVVAFFNMIWFPIGTLIGLYAFWVLLQESAPAYFSRPAAGTELEIGE
jgi:hypothetical protein